MQAIQVVSYPIDFILMKCRTCINWILSAWRGMFNRRQPIKLRCYVPTRGPRRTVPRSQRTQVNRDGAVPSDSEDPASVITAKRSTDKVEREIHYRPAVIPLKWHELATEVLDLADNLPPHKKTDARIVAHILPVPQNDTGVKPPKSQGRKKWQKPTNRRPAKYSELHAAAGMKEAAKTDAKKIKRAPFVNKRWSY